jgi:hypothetical protein
MSLVLSVDWSIPSHYAHHCYGFSLSLASWPAEQAAQGFLSQALGVAFRGVGKGFHSAGFGMTDIGHCFCPSPLSSPAPPSPPCPDRTDTDNNTDDGGGDANLVLANGIGKSTATTEILSFPCVSTASATNNPLDHARSTCRAKV